MKRLVLLLTFACRIVGAGECIPPAAVIARLKNHFTYLNGLGTNRPYDVHFSMAEIRNWLFLRQNTVAPNYVADFRPVWVFDTEKNIEEIQGPEQNCPADSTWVDCAAYWRDHFKDPLQVTSEPPETFRYPPHATEHFGFRVYAACTDVAAFA